MVALIVGGGPEASITLAETKIESLQIVTNETLDNQW